MQITWAAITIFISFSGLDIGIKPPQFELSAYSCRHKYSEQVIRWDGRDSRTTYWFLRGKQVWDIDSNQIKTLDKKLWYCILDIERSRKAYEENFYATN